MIRYFCDRIAVMHRGKIVETGETERSAPTPQHPYTRSLLSAVPVADPRRGADMSASATAGRGRAMPRPEPSGLEESRLMKITDVKTYLIQVGARPTVPGTAAPGVDAEADFRGSRNWLFVKVFTDEGITGVGECSGWPRVIETAVQDYRRILIGEDPRDIDRLWHRMFVALDGPRRARHRRRRRADRHRDGALGHQGQGARPAGLEPARRPLPRPHPGLRPRQDAASGARELMARGYKAMKVGFTGAVDIDRVAAVREAVGPDVDVMVDAHGPSWMTTQDAIVVGRALEPLDLLFYEDPVAPENLDALARVRDAVDIPLAAGERVSTIWGIRPYIERDLVDVIQPDTGRAGGITQMRKMAAMAEAHYITMAPHSGSLGPVAEFAALHVMATIPNALMLERIEFDWSGRYEVVTPGPQGRRRPPRRCRTRRASASTSSRRRSCDIRAGATSPTCRPTTAGPTSPAPSTRASTSRPASRRRTQAAAHDLKRTSPPSQREDLAMRITRLRSFMSRDANRPRVIVAIDTDEGITGWGECYNHGPDRALPPLLDYLFAQIEGEDPRRIEFLILKLLQQARFPPGALGLAAISAIDHCLWDISAKALGPAGLPAPRRRGARQGAGLRRRLHRARSGRGARPRRRR